MDSLLTWYLFGTMSWMFLLVEFKRLRLVHVCTGLMFGIAGVFTCLIFLLMEKEGLFEDPPVDPTAKK